MASIIKRPGSVGKIVFRAEIRRKGYPNQVKTFSRKGDAEKWARKIEREIDRGTWRDLKGAEKLLLKDALERYLTHVSTKKRPRTQVRDKLSASHLKRNLGHLTLIQVTDSAVAKYRDERLKDVSPHSVRIEMALLSNLFNVARREWNIGKIENPVSMVKRPQLPEGRCPILSEDQIERLLEECKQSESEYLHPFVLLALHTGCRSSELRGLKWEQIDLDEGFFSLIGEEIKTHRRRTIPLTKPAKEVFQSLSAKVKVMDMHGKPQGLVFPSRGNPNKPRDMHKTFNQIVRRVGLGNLPGAGKLRIHDLRHCCGSALIMKGVDLETTRKILGHRDITTTQRYVHVIDDHMKNAIDKIGDLGIKPEK